MDIYRVGIYGYKQMRNIYRVGIYGYIQSRDIWIYTE